MSTTKKPKSTRVSGTSDANQVKTLKVVKEPSGDLIGTVKQVEGTPFATVKLSDTETAVVFGKFKVSRKHYQNHEQASKMLNQYDWDMLLNVVGIYIDAVLTEKQQSNDKD